MVVRIRPSRTPVFVTATLLAVLCPAPAFADAGIALIACISPGMWFALPAVAVLEWLIALAVIRNGAWRATKITLVSNCASTLAGFPLTWLIIAILTPLAGHVGDGVRVGYIPGTFVQKVAFNTVSAPIGLSYRQEAWLTEMLICWGCLLLPYFLLSVWIERWCARRLLDKEHRRRGAIWAWVANAASYILLLIVFTRLFLFTWGWLDP